MVGDTLKNAWYALHTKSRFENVVNEGLASKAIDVFLPKITVRSKRRDRRKMIRVPLFPGYVFVRTNLNPYEHVEILKTTGAVKLIGSARGPVFIPDETIESLKIMVSSDQAVVTGTRFKKGDRVIVIAGPFAGVTGIFSSYRGDGRVMVNIEALGQFAAVNVNAADVEKLPEILS
ncbi:MAG: transcriptional antiterminator [Proteobacteria bacterium]|nr:MAG: transcriptional antiterminator [Pseudomonadota bacterium]